MVFSIYFSVKLSHLSVIWQSLSHSWLFLQFLSFFYLILSKNKEINFFFGSVFWILPKLAKDEVLCWQPLNFTILLLLKVGVCLCFRFPLFGGGDWTTKSQSNHKTTPIPLFNISLARLGFFPIFIYFFNLLGSYNPDIITSHPILGLSSFLFLRKAFWGFFFLFSKISLFPL